MRGSITDSGGLGYRDADEIRIRPQPWRERDDQVVQPTAGSNLSPLSAMSAVSAIPTPSLTIPATQAEFDAVIAQVYSDMNIAITDINSVITKINTMITQMNSMLNV